MSCLYNSPFNKTADLINMLYSKFHKYMSHDLIIMGDFNIKTNDPKPSQLKILINQLGLTPQILQNTRPQFNKSNTSTIDQILKSKANAFNSYFINTSQSINTQFTSPINNINPINITPISKSIYLHPTSTHEINYIIQNNKSKTSLDTDYLNMKLLKISKDYIYLPLSHIFNLCKKYYQYYI